jgi:transposase-like protein
MSYAAPRQNLASSRCGWVAAHSLTADSDRSATRTNSRNGYRTREWDTRAGTIDLAIPKLRSGSYYPDWLLERRRRAEQALISVVATSYLLGVSTRRVNAVAFTCTVE